ncbi:MAG TPA: NAD-dependent epimerase/dehydratase family protein [Chthoniobacterales bacterium]|jgi:nucleoside-diphosphate-sugar epimerase|nr:NAD-dependent epimerase/dehydratase family protein [Chthoniobacterales bacterium]
MKILLVGGTGLISGELARAFVQANHEVVIITDGKGSLPAPAGVCGHLIADRNDSSSIRRALQEAPFRKWDAVVDSVAFDASGARALLTALQASRPHTFVISTSFVYSPRVRQPISPQADTGSLAELGAYAFGKASMEQVWASAEQYPFTILRIPHTLAPGSDLGAVPLHNRDPYLIARLQAGLPLYLADGGRQSLQVVWAADVAATVLKAIGRTTTFAKAYNCAHPEILTGRSYCELVAELTGVPLRVRAFPVEALWASKWGWNLCTIPRVLDLTSLVEDIGYIPSTSPRDSIFRCLRAAPSPSEGTYDPSFANVQSIVSESQDQIAKELTALAASRARGTIDARMNSEPLPRWNDC